MGLADIQGVLCRELAQQIAVTAKPLKKLFGISSLCLYGGVDKQRQVSPLALPHCMMYLFLSATRVTTDSTLHNAQTV